jgi:DNA ligase-1
MLFKELTEYFEKLEQTSSRLSLIEILAELFGKLHPDEVPMVSYLIQGRVAPFYEPVEMGMAEKSVAASIARADGVDREEVLKLYGKLGDLGKVAEQTSVIRLQTSDKTKSDDRRLTTDDKLTIKYVFEELRKIADFSGDGTVENKTGTLAALLGKVGPIEAKHLVRIPLGTSRLGIGDPTVLDAFATAKLGSKDQRKLLEGAYNKISDLGLIGKVLWAQGLEGVQELDVTVGRPIRSQLAERINDPKTILEKFGGEAHIQYKFDGFRVQIHKNGDQVRTFSRNLEETTDMLPDIVEGVRKQVKAKTAIFDSEALAFNPESEEFLPFQETTKRRRKYGIEEAAKKMPMKAFVFDVIYMDGKSLVDMPLRERMKVLDKAISGDEVLVKQLGEYMTDFKDIQARFDDAMTKGLEGLIIKRPDSLYEAGARNFNWIKMKKHTGGELKDTIDCVILGYIFGRGKRAEFGAGALLVGIYDKEKDEFVTVAKIGTGLSDDEWREIHKRADKISLSHKPARVNSILEPSVWVEPEIVVEILADEITKSPVHTAGKNGGDTGFALRFPRLVRFREGDKRPEDATTVKELKEMYDLQYKQN